MPDEPETGRRRGPDEPIGIGNFGVVGIAKYREYTAIILKELASKYRREPKIIMFTKDALQNIESGSGLTRAELEAIRQQAIDFDLGLMLLTAAQE